MHSLTYACGVQVLQGAYVKTPAANAPSNVDPAKPRGRWASRLDDQSVAVKSLLDNSCVPGMQSVILCVENYLYWLYCISYLLLLIAYSGLFAYSEVLLAKDQLLQIVLAVMH